MRSRTKKKIGGLRESHYHRPHTAPIVRRKGPPGGEGRCSVPHRSSRDSAACGLVWFGTGPSRFSAARVWSRVHGSFTVFSSLFYLAGATYICKIWHVCAFDKLADHIQSTQMCLLQQRGVYVLLRTWARRANRAREQPRLMRGWRAPAAGVYVCCV